MFTNKKQLVNAAKLYILKQRNNVQQGSQFVIFILF